MISFRQKIFMTSEGEDQEVYFLRCKICQKEFPRFDQRGFRNAGFTAHQNRCIEREYLLHHPAPEHQSSPRQRFLLPAPPTSSSSSLSSVQRLIIGRSNSSSPVAQQQQYQQNFQLPSTDNTLSCGTQSTGIHYVPENANLLNLQLPQEDSACSQQQQQQKIDLSLYSGGVNYIFPETSNTIISEMPHEMIFPVLQCNYCQPEFGLHQPNCLYLEAFLRQPGSM